MDPIITKLRAAAAEQEHPMSRRVLRPPRDDWTGYDAWKSDVGRWPSVRDCTAPATDAAAPIEDDEAAEEGTP